MFRVEVGLICDEPGCPAPLYWNLCCVGFMYREAAESVLREHSVYGARCGHGVMFKTPPQFRVTEVK